MRLESLQIKNFRSIKDTGELSPTKLFALIGRNNSGKSTIIKAVQVLLAQDPDPIKETDFHKGTTESIEMTARLTDFYDEAYDKFKNAEGVAEIKFECGTNLTPTFFLNGKKVSQKEIQGLPELLVIPAIRNPQNESTAGSKSILKNILSLIFKQQKKNQAEAKESCETKPKETAEVKLGEATEQQIRVALESRSKEQIFDISQVVNQTFRNIIVDPTLSIEISPIIDLSKGISYHTKLIDSDLASNMGQGIDIMTCGTGLQSMFILSLLETYANIAQCNDSILLIEEPEVYLHPDFQRKMFTVLKKIASANQVIYTTHSPIMISELWADDSVRLVRMDQGKTMIEKIDIEAVISELGIKYEDVLSARAVVFVEGDSDVVFFKAIAKYLKPEICDSLDRRIKFIPSDGYRNINSYAYMKIINSENVRAEFHLIADSDGRLPEERQKDLANNIKAKLGKVGTAMKTEDLKCRITILKEHAIESYFLEKSLLHDVFPDLSELDLQKMISIYREKYSQHLKGLLEKANVEKKEQEAFQWGFKSKNIFTNSKLKKPQAYKNFSVLFDNNEEFLNTRNLIAKKCDEMSKEGKSPIEFILSKVDFSKENFKEPVSIMQNILKQSENN